MHWNRYQPFAGLREDVVGSGYTGERKTMLFKGTPHFCKTDFTGHSDLGFKYSLGYTEGKVIPIRWCRGVCW